MRNWQRWAITIGLAAFTGIATTFSDPEPPTLWEVTRHAGIAVLPLITALMMRLNQNEK